mmetsp:Transcript_22947/g.64457  ORF Transcript_22947/g.64457 Transcript_22947/m.64457 type:complete len:402 (-) Transcript_22947:69-1274(-)
MAASFAARGLFAGAILLSSCPRLESERPRVEALDPVAVGHVRALEDLGGRPLQIRTLALDPPVFLLPGFLNDAEADEVRSLAQGWESSQAGDGDKERNQLMLQSGGKQALNVLRHFDKNRDQHLTRREFQMFVKDVFGLPNFNGDDFASFAALANGAVADGSVNRDSIKLERVLKADPVPYFQELGQKEPHRYERFSETVWIEHNTPLMWNILNRTAAVTGLPDVVIKNTEPLQVVRYPPLGHYACHHDSTPDSIDSGEFRFATLGMFLNDVPAGGETAFPGADVEGAAKWGPENWAKLEDRCQVTEACTSLGGLVVRPRKGDGLLWYNVKPRALSELAAGRWDRGKGYGERTLLWSSMHCGAEVHEGEKVFANLWLHLPRSWTEPQKRRRRRHSAPTNEL